MDNREVEGGDRSKKPKKSCFLASVYFQDNLLKLKVELGILRER